MTKAEIAGELDDILQRIAGSGTDEDGLCLDVGLFGKLARLSGRLAAEGEAEAAEAAAAKAAIEEWEAGVGPAGSGWTRSVREGQPHKVCEGPAVVVRYARDAGKSPDAADPSAPGQPDRDAADRAGAIDRILAWAAKASGIEWVNWSGPPSPLATPQLCILADILGVYAPRMTFDLAWGPPGFGPKAGAPADPPPAGPPGGPAAAILEDTVRRKDAEVADLKARLATVEADAKRAYNLFIRGIAALRPLFLNGGPLAGRIKPGDSYLGDGLPVLIAKLEAEVERLTALKSGRATCPDPS